MNTFQFAVITTLLLYIAIFITIHAHGEEFKMTPQLNKETRLLQTCIIFNITDRHCDMIYGGIPK